jgi:hypothetical protein
MSSMGKKSESLGQTGTKTNSLGKQEPDQLTVRPIESRQEKYYGAETSHEHCGKSDPRWRRLNEQYKDFAQI